MYFVKSSLKDQNTLVIKINSFPKKTENEINEARNFFGNCYKEKDHKGISKFICLESRRFTQYERISSKSALWSSTTTKN